MKLVRTTAVAVALLSASSAAAQWRSDQASTRAAGMGNAGLWLRDDAALFYNPAQLAVARGTSVSGEYRSADDHDGALSSATSFGKGGVAVGMTARQQTTTPLVDVGGALVNGPPESVTSLLAAAGIGQTFKGQRLGVVGKYDSRQFGNSRYSQTLLDIGVAHDFGRYITAGVVARDVRVRGGYNYNWNPYRTVAGVAASGPVGPLDVVTALNVSSGPDVGWETNFGAEAAYSWLSGYSIAARAGTSSPDGPRHFTLGVGLTRDRVSIDYAFDNTHVGPNGHRVGLRIQ